jgi:hypothetical protein
MLYILYIHILSLLTLKIKKLFCILSFLLKFNHSQGFTGPEGSHPLSCSVRWQEPEDKSHSRIVLSELPDARSRPLAENVTDSTPYLQTRSKN